MSLALDSALSGLRVAQRQLDVISGNVSNSSTDGYTRKVLNQESQVVNGQTIGVLGSTITRSVDMNMQKEVWTQVSASSFYDVQSTYMSQIQAFNGPADKELSIAATIAGLQDAFVQLTNQPDDQTQMAQAVSQAKAVAKKFNDYSNMLTDMRNDTQAQLADSVIKVNDLLKKIADYNSQIKFNSAAGGSVASTQDQRDQAIKQLSDLIGITSFTRGDGVLVVQTAQGQQLADETASVLVFNPSPVNANTATAAGIYLTNGGVVTKTSSNLAAIDAGGKIGGYLAMRDATLPKYQAQLDEMAQKLAMRFDAQGVRLFTDASGGVPADTAPSTNPVTPVPYVGFSSQIQVNVQVLRDNTLIQRSTLANVSVQAGSVEFLNRIVDYAFGANEYQKAAGTVDLRVSGGVAPNNTLQNVLGLNPKGQVIGTVNIRALSPSMPLNAAAGNPYTATTDTLTVRFDTGGVNDTGDINISLAAVDAAFPSPPATSGADALVSYLNTNVIGGLAPPLNGQIGASLNQFGQLVLDSQVATTIGTGTMGADGLTYLGLKAGTTTQQNPYMDIQIGQDNPVRITVDPGDDETTLLTKLNNIPGVQASINATTGFLTIRPGPNFGGDLKITAGGILSTGGDNMVKVLFGSETPVVGVANAAFRINNLGPGAGITTGVVANGSSIIDFAQKVISAVSQEASNTASKLSDESSYRDLISKQFTDNSGVNLDEELAQLIVIQTAYSASAKTISTLNEMFEKLLGAF
ncbi:MAG: flgK [Micavibrio sp.]|nr:flgK [Micavibrio sp.]